MCFGPNRERVSSIECFFYVCIITFVYSFATYSLDTQYVYIYGRGEVYIVV